MRRRLLLVAALGALAVAAPAAAFLPPVPHSAVGEGRPLRAYASITPPVHLFGDAVTARVAVVADTKWVDPARLRVTASFEPYRSVHKLPTVAQTGSGRFLQLTWTWTLRCLSAKCIPVVPPSDKYHVFRFRPATIAYLNGKGEPRYAIRAAFPAVEVLSQVSPGVSAFLARNNALNWQFKLAPVASPDYAVSPSLAFWFALSLAGLLGATGLVLGGRWAWALLPHRRRRAAAPGTPLERALALYYWAHEHGDDTLQRKALERVAEELEPTGHDLSEIARALAWSPEEPADEDVQAIRAHLGVPEATA